MFVWLISCNNPSAQENTSDSYIARSDRQTVSKAEPVNTNKDLNTKLNTKPVKLTKQDFLDLVMDYERNPEKWIYKGELPCLIDFYADWCAPCRITAPILEELAEEYAGKINIYKVDIQREKELAQVFGITGIPAFLYCPLEGNPSITSGIARTVEETKQLFKNQIESILLTTDI
ncbi:MAG: thiol reductase thioredoxin [Bacteroidales bacterium]|nr:MAG: thiol reductase thioredoxin [Bacteroidales bacterium]